MVQRSTRELPAVRRRLAIVLCLVGLLLAPGAAHAGEPSSPTTPSSSVVVKKALLNREPPQVFGYRAIGSALHVTPGLWSEARPVLRYQWFSDGQPIPGATSSTLLLAEREVGSTVHARVTASRVGFATVAKQTTPREVVREQPDVRRTVTFEVDFRGGPAPDRDEFVRQVRQTLDDPRGWRSAGIAFEPVDADGDVTVVLAEPSTLPSYSPICSASYSCRAGDFVVINAGNWADATRSWRAGDGTLRDYRHMVVNHEMGHWLGRGHVGCGADGALAPVMQQQSKDLAGCDVNPWPLADERSTPRFDG